MSVALIPDIISSGEAIHEPYTDMFYGVVSVDALSNCCPWRLNRSWLIMRVFLVVLNFNILFLLKRTILGGTIYIHLVIQTGRSWLLYLKFGVSFILFIIIICFDLFYQLFWWGSISPPPWHVFWGCCSNCIVKMSTILPKHILVYQI